MLEDYTRSRNLHTKKKKTKTPTNKKGTREDKKGDHDTGLMYSQETFTPGDNGKVHPNIKCNDCDKYGHYLLNCSDGGGKQNLILKEESEDEEVAA